MRKKILIVDDSYFFRSEMSRILTAFGYEVISTDSGEKALEIVKAEKPDLVLLDVVMPDIDGFEVCRILRSAESNNLMPIIMLTAKDDLDDKLVGLELGADDYITKPFNERELLSRIRNTLRRIDRNRSANPLTGLAGNLEIQREINSKIALQKKYAIIYADLDNFKSFNDVYGFAQGDLVIKMTADIISDQVHIFGNPTDFIGHIGGDDFTVVTTPEKAEEICSGIIDCFDEKVTSLYKLEDVERGHITSINRKGETDTYPIMTISLAIVTNIKRQFRQHLEVAEVASEVKKKLKMMEGSNMLVDRRKS